MAREKVFWGETGVEGDRRRSRVRQTDRGSRRSFGEVLEGTPIVEAALPVRFNEGLVDRLKGGSVERASQRRFVTPTIAHL